MSEEIFRKKSLDKIKSPESLDDYIRVSSPGLWLLLVSVIVLLAGACVWGLFGQLDSTVKANTRVQNGSAVCYISEEDIYSVMPGMTIKLDEYEGVIVDIGQRDGQSYVCTISVEQPVPDGLYDGRVIVDTVKPFSFIMN